MAIVNFHKDLCKGCQLCTFVCPQKILVMSEKLNSKGFQYPTVTEMKKCTGCGFCAWMCPDVVIEVEKEVS